MLFTLLDYFISDAFGIDATKLSGGGETRESTIYVDRAIITDAGTLYITLKIEKKNGKAIPKLEFSLE